MILAAAAGFALREIGIPDALPWSIVVGFLVAPLLPAKTSCPLSRRGDE